MLCLYEQKAIKNIAYKDYDLLLFWHLKNGQPGNRSQLELLMIKFSTKSYQKNRSS